MNIISMATEWTDQFGTLQEKLFLGTAIALVGFLIVFFLLTAIIISISIMSGVLKFSDKRKKTKKETALEITLESKESLGYKPDLTSSDDSQDLIAVITAAVCVYMESGKVKSRAPYPGFRVKNIRRL